ncbi:hypothetical protein KAT59_00275, partial [Candidatus Bipolaricaulota bacterium]|nr:hypothetical protein [Candidatus Bipolaricaulota bacterium]
NVSWFTEDPEGKNQPRKDHLVPSIAISNLSTRAWLSLIASSLSINTFLRERPEMTFQLDDSL